MNKVMIIGVVAVVLVGGAFFVSLNQSNEPAMQKEEVMQKNDTAMEKKDGDAMEKDAMMQKEETDKGDAMMQKDISEEGAMMKKEDSNTAAMSRKGSYGAYDQAKLVNAEMGDVVLFFHAGWCPKCVTSEKNFKASATPDGLTLMKLDFDNSFELRKKYGVTVQHTFVQVDKDGNLIKKWSGSYTYADLEAQIQ